MVSRAKEHWRLFRRAQPGTRFQRLHEARADSPASRVAATILGILLLVGGIVLLFIPGPGLLLIAFGAGLLAQQSRWLAQRLDRLEPLLRRLAARGRASWRRASTPVRVAIASGGLVVAALAGYGAYVLLIRN
jgi:hypothetical protein